MLELENAFFASLPPTVRELWRAKAELLEFKNKNSCPCYQLVRQSKDEELSIWKSIRWRVDQSDVKANLELRR